MIINREEAALRLTTAGYRDVAERLSYWRNKRGNSWGWDGWLRGVAKREQRPDMIDAVWT
jgi:hypothetical protein